MNAGAEGDARGLNDRLQQRLSEVAAANSGGSPASGPASRQDEVRFEENRRARMEAARRRQQLVDLIDTFRQVMKAGGDPGMRGGSCSVEPYREHVNGFPTGGWIPQPPRSVPGYPLPASPGRDRFWFIEALSTWSPEQYPSLNPCYSGTFDEVGSIHVRQWFHWPHTEDDPAVVEDLLRVMPEKLGEVLALHGLQWPPEISDQVTRLPADWLTRQQQTGVHEQIQAFLRLARSRPIAPNVMLNPGSRHGPDYRATYERIGFELSSWKKQVRRTLGRAPLPGWIVGYRTGRSRDSDFYHYLVLLESGDLWLAGNEANRSPRNAAGTSIRTLVPTQSHPYRMMPDADRTSLTGELVEDKLAEYLTALLNGTPSPHST